MDDTNKSQPTTATGDGSTKTEEKPKVSYTPEQQQHLDTVVIPSRLKRERAVVTAEVTEQVTEQVTRALRAQYESDVEALHTELAAAKKGIVSNAEKAESQRALSEANARAAALQEQAKLAVEHASKRDAEIYKRDKRDAMVTAMGDRFVNQNAVLVITDGAVQRDSTTGEFVVVDQKGHIRINASLEPLSLEAYFGEIAEQHPYLAAGKTKGGTGSSSSNSNGPQTRQILAKEDIRTDAERIRYIKESGYAKFAALPLKRPS